MKTRMLVSIPIFVVLVMLVPAFLFAGRCGEEEEGCTKPTGPDYYHIRFTLDGPAIDAQDIILNFGGHNGQWLVWWPNLNWMEMSGWYCRGGESAAFPTFKLWARLIPLTPGVYEGVYGGSGPSVGILESRITIIEGGIEYGYNVTDGTLTITAYGDVGGEVVGTFDFTIEKIYYAPSFHTPLTAKGEFRVLRGPDDYSTPAP